MTFFFLFFLWYEFVVRKSCLSSRNLTIYILIFKLPDVFLSLHRFIVFTYIISSHKWSTTHRVLKSHRSKMGIIYMQSWKQCALLVITTMAFWQLMHLGTWCTVYIYIYISFSLKYWMPQLYHTSSWARFIIASWQWSTKTNLQSCF